MSCKFRQFLYNHISPLQLGPTLEQLDELQVETLIGWLVAVFQSQPPVLILNRQYNAEWYWKVYSQLRFILRTPTLHRGFKRFKTNSIGWVYCYMKGGLARRTTRTAVAARCRSY